MLLAFSILLYTYSSLSLFTIFLHIHVFFCCVPLLCCSCCYYDCWKLEDFLFFASLYSSGWFSLWLNTLAYWETMNIKTCYTSHFCTICMIQNEKLKLRKSQKLCIACAYEMVFLYMFLSNDLLSEGLSFCISSNEQRTETTVWLNNFQHPKSIHITHMYTIYAYKCILTHSLRTCDPSVLGIW